MIDSFFIVRYTNGLYSTPVESAPRYDEFRDMFSSGQLASKEWIVSELRNLNTIMKQRIIIAGSWFGTLGIMLKTKFPCLDITMLDIDPRCKVFLDNITYTFSNVRAVTGDMYDYSYDEDVVINTSCEHIPDVRVWLDLLPKNTIVVLQSNDYKAPAEHINCVSTITEFEQQANLSSILYSGKLETPMYTRFMIIGKT